MWQSTRCDSASSADHYIWTQAGQVVHNKVLLHCLMLVIVTAKEQSDVPSQVAMQCCVQAAASWIVAAGKCCRLAWCVTRHQLYMFRLSYVVSRFCKASILCSCLTNFCHSNNFSTLLCGSSNWHTNAKTCLGKDVLVRLLQKPFYAAVVLAAKHVCLCLYMSKFTTSRQSPCSWCKATLLNNAKTE